MRLRTWLSASFIPLALSLSLLCAADEKKGDDTGITWKKTIVDKKFRSEGVAVADVNKDGKLDILAGEVWYEAPDWKMHEIRKPFRDYGNGLGGYSESFACWCDDLNGDGWQDYIVIRFPGAPCYWYENPKGKDEHWKEHMIWHSACNETPTYVDLFGNGKRVLLMAFQPKGKDNEGQMAYFTPAKDPTQLWEMHPISEPSTKDHVIPGTFRFSHGLGVGDVNGDGKLDVAQANGYDNNGAILLGNGDGTLQAASIYPIDGSAVGSALGDLDGDGDLDWVISSFGAGRWYVLRNDGTGSFTEVSEIPAPSSASCASLYDFDNNGTLDMALADEVADVILLEKNDGATSDVVFRDGFDG
jgi:hypothetical protein